MRRIFLDCGGHAGESIAYFLTRYPDHDFYTFEPNKDLADPIVRTIKALGRTVFFYPGAVWTHDGFLDFFIGHDQGSTAMPGKVEIGPGIPQVDYSNALRVPCIDLSGWLLRSTSPDDFIVIKLDVEGAEYQLLPKMISDGSIDRVHTLFCEWHQDRFPNITEDFHNTLVETISQRTKLEYWH